MSAADVAYRAWLLRNGAEPTERERWLLDALALAARWRLLRRPGETQPGDVREV